MALHCNRNACLVSRSRSACIGPSDFFIHLVRDLYSAAYQTDFNEHSFSVFLVFDRGSVKRGTVGHRLYLSPSEEVLDSLADVPEEYIAQRKVDYTTFITDDGQEKIVELRFMTARHNAQVITVPMARIGHVERDQDDRKVYKIHFGDNNMPGYGFAPVLIFNE